METETIDAIITDPPYGAGGRTEAERMKGRAMTGSDSPWSKRWFLGDGISTAGLVWLLRSVAFEATRLLRPGGSLLVFCDWRMWSSIVPAMESAGLGLQQMIVWDKGSGTYFSRNGSNVIRHARVVRGKEHPTQKPVEVMEQLLEVVTPEGGLVVDPFCGSGTTGVACLRRGRRFVGIDRDPEYVQIARRRLQAAAARKGAA